MTYSGIHLRASAAALAVTLLTAACGPDEASPPLAPPATPAETPAVLPTDPPSTGEARPVRLALDWTPNTNHLGFFVAQAQGWYADAGVELDVLPYTGTAPETILAAGQADCGISFHDAMTFAVAAGAPITSAMAILQHTAQ
jgi:ABC-type nitrate/sulfonate/bicarbonate transport system substrate-binding protein